MLLRLLKTAGNSGKSLFRATYSSGYVARTKYLQKLKDDGAECAKAMEKGFFVYYNKNSILIRREKSLPPGPLWLPYEATTHAFSKMKKRFDLDQNCVLLDIAQDGNVRFGLQLHPIDDEKKKILETLFGGKFEELRFYMMLTSEDVPCLTRGRSLLYWHWKMQFCSNCGVKTTKNKAGSQRVCNGCRTVHYPSLWPVVMGLICNKQKCLLIRQKMHVKGVFTAVAGFMEAGEPPEQAIRREIAEEVGIEVDTLEYIRSQHWPFPMSSLMMGFLASTKLDQTLSLDPKEIEDAQWFDLKSVKSALDLVTKEPTILLKPPKNQLLVPPPGPLAHYLIREWITRNS